MSNVYRYTLGSNVSMHEVQESLQLAILAMECLHGTSQTRLELSHEFDPKKRICVIDAGTPVGRDLNRLFTGFIGREFGPNSFSVERVRDEHQQQDAAK